ncbi:hypothetical protein N7509_003710 [Penicillium cosmopolitanum]|uniref:Uncharacterized protein n=1 Tax=Penicillium cosmopolitanum TaxID=1131564 RepID=A0A9W9W5E3_9EURO|nr:uncharacterized protein N7509_003710 [Penicillium cosmopolitanum]KAJ5403839.1 hypothetical protein N7509_003710 [Penicillium cosmopolitanum]
MQLVKTSWVELHELKRAIDQLTVLLALTPTRENCEIYSVNLHNTCFGLKYGVLANYETIFKPSAHKYSNEFDKGDELRADNKTRLHGRRNLVSRRLRPTKGIPQTHRTAHLLPGSEHCIEECEEKYGKLVDANASKRIPLEDAPIPAGFCRANGVSTQKPMAKEQPPSTAHDGSSAGTARGLVTTTMKLTPQSLSTRQ